MFLSVKVLSCGVFFSIYCCRCHLIPNIYKKLCFILIFPDYCIRTLNLSVSNNLHNNNCKLIIFYNLSLLALLILCSKLSLAFRRSYTLSLKAFLDFSLYIYFLAQIHRWLFAIHNSPPLCTHLLWFLSTPTLSCWQCKD